MPSLREYKSQVSPYSWEEEEPQTQYGTGIYYTDPQGIQRINPYRSTVQGRRERAGLTMTGSTGRGVSYPVGGGSAGGTRKTVTTKTPTMPKPEAPDVPAFTPPKYDEAKVKRLAQKHAAPSLRRLRSALQQEMGRSYENPNVRAMTLREALQGYGLGVEGALSQAGSAARSEYGAEYQRKYAGAMTTYQTQQQMAMQAYQNAFNAYLQSMQQTTTTGPGGEDEASGGWQASDFGPGIWAQSMKKAVGA